MAPTAEANAIDRPPLTPRAQALNAQGTQTLSDEKPESITAVDKLKKGDVEHSEQCSLSMHSDAGNQTPLKAHAQRDKAGGSCVLHA